MQKDSKIFVAGARGMVGSAIVRQLKKNGYTNLLLPSSDQLDLRDQQSTHLFFKQEQPEYVFLAAAKVGGILTNSKCQADFFYDNMAIELHTIHESYLSGVKKFCFLGSSCIYPKLAKQPIQEESLMTGHLEPTNFGYASAKIAGIQMCEAYADQYQFNYVALMPCNLYGHGDNFDLKSSHVLSALLRKVVEAKESNQPNVSMWGTGKPRREFLFVDDVAQACIMTMEKKEVCGLYNVGMGTDISIHELLIKICSIVGYTGAIDQDLSKPDGTPRKLLDIQKILTLGWKPTIELDEGIKRLHQAFLEQRKDETTF